MFIINVRDRIIHIHQSKACTRPLLRKLLAKDPSLSSLYQLSAHDLIHEYQLTSKQANQLIGDLHDNSMLAQMEQDLTRFKIWTIIDHDYPKALKMIPDPPYVLYGLGNPSLIHHTPSISVVGTRNPSSEAKRKMHVILTPLVEDDWLLVSGMALGIDGYAHRIANHFHGKTIAVLGGGLNFPYPKKHEPLFKTLVSQQLVISEYPPNTRPERYFFPERNRIISGLAFGTLVVEAQERSGSLITVDQALEQGREVYAVPGCVYLEQTQGCHKLIQDGAKLVQNTYDLMGEWQEHGEKWCRTLTHLQ